MCAKKNFTTEQTAAIKSRQNQILISAAAGSGKTAVLIERLLTLIVEENLSLEHLLVVTFTENAAAEMKERLQEALLQKLEQLEEETDSQKLKRHLTRQLALMPTADISTIHSFCLRLVRDYFHYIDIAPGFRIGDETELELLKGQVMEELFEEEYETNQAFAELAESFGGGKTKDYRLDALIRRIFNLLEGSAYPLRTAERYLQNAATLSAWLAIILEEARASVAHALTLISRAKKLCRLPDGPAAYLDNLDSDEELLEKAAKLLQTQDFSEILPLKFGTLYTYRGKAKEEIDPDLQQQVKDLREAAKKELEAVKNFFPGNTEEYFEKSKPVTKALLALSLKYREKYATAKRDRGLADFNDLEHFAVEILWQKPEGSQRAVPSPAARALSQKYREIMTDEYQDTSEVQELILSALVQNAPVGDAPLGDPYEGISQHPRWENRRFMVGDIKQSIYGFRRAKPQLFLEKSKMGAIFLSKNFRSSLEVIDTVNFLFERLMADTEIAYDAQARLEPGLALERDAGLKTELHLLQTDDDKLTQEARLIARRIHELAAEGFKHSDIVILVRGLKSIAEDLTEALKQENINAMAQVDGGFFKTPEVMLALSILRVVDNPRQDIDLLAVLRLYGFSPDDLLAIRLSQAEIKARDFYDCLTFFANKEAANEEGELNNLAAKFLKDLAEWRKQAVLMPISRLLGFLYDQTKLLEAMAKMPGGAIREANLRLLMEKAIQYEESSYSGLFHFVRYMEWLQQQRVDESPVKLLPGDDSVVQVMTIHKSKGLEFPVVFVSRLGTQFQDEKQNVILHPELGIGAKYTNLTLRTRSDTITRQALRLLSKNERAAEELRVLYVALTRAEKKLILTGAVKNLPKAEAEWQKVGLEGDKISWHVLKKSKCFLDWIMPCVLEAGGDSPIRYVRAEVIAGLTRNPLSEHAQQAALGIPRQARNDANGVFATAPYPYAYEASLPSKLAISELKRIYALETTPESHSFYDEYSQSEAAFRPPAFLDKTPHINMGTLLHTAVEHMDLHTVHTMTDIENLLADLNARALITPEESAMFDADAKAKLLRFANSDLAARMRNAKVYREVPFVMAVSPEEVYGAFSSPQRTREKILVHGIIDCYFIEESGKVVLVDFKSGKPEGLAARYGTQMAVYRRALEQYLNREVNESLFYSFAEGSTIINLRSIAAISARVTSPCGENVPSG